MTSSAWTPVGKYGDYGDTSSSYGKKENGTLEKVGAVAAVAGPTAFLTAAGLVGLGVAVPLAVPLAMASIVAGLGGGAISLYYAFFD
jgi:hypothetical protein